MMNKWVKIDDKKFGSFDKPYFTGVILNNDNEYEIGRYTEDYEKDGFNMIKDKEGHVTLQEYEKGVPLYPLVNVIDEVTVEITLGLASKNSLTEFYSLLLNLEDGSFLYSIIKDGEIVNDAIKFDGSNNVISFLTMPPQESVKEYPISRKFIPDRPIVGKCPITIPEKVNFDNFEFRGDGSYAVNENSSSKTDPGIGFIEWDDGVYCVGGWNDNYRDGWQIYHNEPDDIQIYYGHHTSSSGLYIRRIKDTIFIKIVDGRNFEDNSYMLTFERNTLTFSEINKEYRLDKCGPGVTFDDLKTVTFKNYADDSEKNATVLEVFYKEKLQSGEKAIEKPKVTINKLVEEIKPEEPITFGPKPDPELVIKKPEENKDDPEYKILHLIGQNDVKKEFVRIKAYLLKNNALDIPTNIIFSGGPGTGKTTVGKLLTDVLYKFKAIDRNRYFEISAKKLYSNYNNESTNKINEIYPKARGGVFLIDDAHYLGALNNAGIKEAITALATLMEEDPRTVFILSDTKYNINELVDNNLDVLENKFRFKINFSDFSRDELKEIINLRIKEKEYVIKEDALNALLDVIFLSKTYGNDINATAALSILEEVIVAQNVRTLDSNEKEITKADIDTYVNDNDIAFIDPKTGGQSDARAKLDEMIGLEHIKETIDDLIAYFSMNRGKKVDFHMAFSGNPGTGKTEVARIVGKLLRQEGILGTTKFVEVTRRDLVGEYIGQSAIRTRDIIDKAMGGVLYIDEAYSLAYGGEKDFGREVIAELLKAMEDRRGEFCVILSGYTNEMKKLFDTNPGFYSRIKFNLEFPDYKDDELEKICQLFLNRDKYTASKEIIKIFVNLVAQERSMANFANARTLREYISRVQIKQASRIRKAQSSDIDPHELLLEDVIATFGEDRVKRAKENISPVEVPKLDPNRLHELYKDYKDVPFNEYKDFIREIVVAIRTTGPKSGESSGFIVTNDGYIVTCAHCVEGAETIEVRRRIYHNGKRIDIKYEADTVSIDTKTDVAVIKIRCDKDDEFDFIALADKNTRLEPLSMIYQMGYPFGWSRFDEMSVNEGKISSYQKGKEGEPDQINLDIEAHGGNSGSLLVDAKTSKVIGILNGASLSPHGAIIEEINYSRPIFYVWDLIEKDFKE